MSCGTIALGSDVACDAQSKGGTVATTLTLFNYDEIDGYTEASSKVTAIDLATDARGWQFTGFRNDVKKSEEVVNPGVGLNQFKHNFGFVIYERTQAQKDNIEKLCKGRFVAIIENKGKDADAFEVVGKSVGLEVVVGPIRNAHENGGFFILNFSTPEGEFEPKLPQTLGTAYANAETVLAALLVPAS